MPRPLREKKLDKEDKLGEGMQGTQLASFYNEQQPKFFLERFLLVVLDQKGEHTIQGWEPSKGALLRSRCKSCNLPL